MKEAAKDLLRRVCRTKDRQKGARDFFVQLSETDLQDSRFKNAKWVILEKKYPGFKRACEGYGEEISRVRIKARLHRFSKKDAAGAVAENSVRMDQTLRVALGVLTGEDCRSVPDGRISEAQKTEMNQVEIAPFSSKWSPGRMFTDLLHRLVGTQPLMMRVRYSLYSDMEVPVCRIKPTLFDVLGITEGDFVEISAIDKKANTENRTPVRALALDSADIEKRKEKIKTEEDFYPDVEEIMGLSALDRDETDLPWICLDYDRRKHLDVWPGDVVRVCRSSRHLLWKRSIIMAIPLFVGLASWILEEQGLDNNLGLGLFIASLAIVPVAVVYQIRKEII